MPFTAAGNAFSTDQPHVEASRGGPPLGRNALTDTRDKCEIIGAHVLMKRDRNQMIFEVGDGRKSADFEAVMHGRPNAKGIHPSGDECVKKWLWRVDEHREK